MVKATHHVTNQTPPFGDINLFDSNYALQEGIQTLTGQCYSAALSQYGALMGSEQMRYRAERANRFPPHARIWDDQGHRLDQVEFHPDWHELLALGFRHGLHCAAWSGEPHAQVVRAAHFLLHGQVEAGTLCPMTMTSAAIPLLRNDPGLAAFVRKMQCRDYDERDIHWERKHAVMVGMGLTEKQGGSDLRGTSTQAEKVSASQSRWATASAARGYQLTGHKWFFSSPTSDAHLVLAKHDGALSCFFVPRILDDGSRNSVHIQRLKDKVGNRSNASAEVEFHDAYGVLLGEPGRGVAQLVTMASYTRLDCVLGSTALLRQAVVHAVHHARHRQAFGRSLIQQPLMKTVLTDLALESEAATVLSLHLANALDQKTLLARAYQRIVTPAAKFFVCKRAIAAIGECMEVLGGNGYIEPGPLARLYREAPVNSIWEGSGNIMCLDVLRALSRAPDLAETLLVDLQEGCSQEPLLKACLHRLMAGWGERDDERRQADARSFAVQLVLLIQAILLRRHAPEYVADAFIATRLDRPQPVLGVVSVEAESERVLSRAWPV